ncbi:hypothetical protein BS50DRAFT_115741 [Corynespora cassiicola Philippines]|uniref:PhoD-like phosphatase domain-containing protein n=1 Tax=Corynespora cassiicola Philippines TaxID=1448308 RepID=A0A2T2NDL4_CORCC|nr:hypothetical protein BS50DRAFT_115741 [Corynespora cassiicola Philippines]
MENSRNSGSQSSPAAMPTRQPVLEAASHKSQKPTSYRRPIDAQPAHVYEQAAVASKTVPSNSARPVAASSAPPNGASRASSHRRRYSQHIPPPTTGASEEPLPAVPDAPRAPPPTAYRDPYASKGSSRGAQRSRDPTVQTNASRHQPNVQAANRLHELRSPPYAPVEPLSGTIEGSSRRGPRRPSVPDRSPLQKLEGKLDDISKEEKRARILEMELAAQEKAEAEMRARRAREAAAKQQRIVSGPVPASDRGGSAPARTASNRRHASMPVQPPQPPSPDLGDIESDDSVAYDLSDPWDPSGGQTTGSSAPYRAPSQSKDHRLSSGSQREQSRQPRAEGTAARTPSVKGKEPVGAPRATGSFSSRAETAGGPVQPPQQIGRKPVAGATGLGLYGVDEPPNATRPAGANVGRYNSVRLSKELPPSPRNPSHDRARDSRGIVAAQREIEQQSINQTEGTRGFDHVQLQTSQAPQVRQMPPIPRVPPVPVPTTPTARRSVGFAPGVESHPHASQESFLQEGQYTAPDVFSHNEPDRRYVPTPMLEEWRSAPVATLVAEDLDLDALDQASGPNKAWWEENSGTRPRQSRNYAQTNHERYVDGPVAQTTFSPPLYLKCGPLLRYTGLRKDRSRAGKEREIWKGSVMIVTIDSQSSYSRPPTMRLFKQPMDILPPPPVEVEGSDLNPAYVDPIEGQPKISRSGKTLFVKPIHEIEENKDLSRVEDDSGLFQEAGINPVQKSSRIWKKDGEKVGKYREIPGARLHAERGVTFWRFNLEIELSDNQTRIAYKINHGPAIGFWVPARGETMNVMFHSCNGFSLSVDPKEFCGPDPMWRDVLNNHQTRPFHVMIGGGDQIYNDAAMRQTTLFRQWTESRNPLQKHNASFSSELQNELEQFYLDRYSMWFSQGLFGMANSQIPMINIWDDHDIIDGYGSYPHHFMQTPVFTGLGAVAFKYYMLFQHQSVSSETTQTEPSWVLGAHPGPYIKEQSRSVFVQLGRHVAFLGLDCRTERQRDEIITEDSYDVIFDRLEDEIIKGETKHLIVLLGVPIAYPRLNFLENVLTSRVMDPIKALGRTGMLGNFVNKFDGGVEILDDLDDHWTAKHHKDERNWLIRELQHIASTKSVRITILGGDVHLAAVGQFYTNKKHKIPKDKDHRYMPNVVSSAIVNTPPPDMMADILNKRNKVHHLDHDTDEDMIPLFTHDVDGKKRNNNHLLPHRNWCSLREYKPGTTPPATPSLSDAPGADGAPRLSRTLSDFTPGKMVRRMSGSERRGRKRGPPMAYYNNPAYQAADHQQTAPQSSFSPERSSEERPRSRRHSISSLFRRRASVDSVDHPTSSKSTSALRDRPSVSRGSMSADRPSAFHRRPSVLGRRASQHAGEYINLEGGLEVTLNLEVSQRDPAGITMPYRLLVPALDYMAPAEPATVEKPPRKSRISGMFGSLRGRNKRTVGDDGYSHSGSSAGSRSSDELGEVEGEEQARQRYKVGPRILLPGFSGRRRSSSQPQGPQLTSGYAEAPTQPPHTAEYAPRGPADHRQSVDMSSTSASYQHPPVSPWENVAGKRHVSAPVNAQAQTIPSRSNSNRGPMYNSSHKSQLPDPEPQAHRRSMGGILNQHRGERWEHDAHVVAHTPSRSKRESYPPHPAIVGAGPGSPYGRSDMQARNDTGGGDYFSSRSGEHNDSAGVGAEYLGEGMYADDDGGRSYDEGGDQGSEESFVPPKPKPKWKIWR